ncbi:hypothetical protein BDD12DRAFT_877169 [Trichophaea hybrida]|nr:hypothetical protein BDD12DRAFT_877169 [Trichophaea hybrida]
MSGFGRPPGALTFSPTPPQRGSFPLDHDGECKPVMVEYLACLKRVKGTNDQTCRLIAKEYLKCRMDRQLMVKDEMANLGFQDEIEKKQENRLEELKRENAKLVKERRRKEAQQ